SEPDAPGAAEINALDYLRFVVGDDTIPLADRDFILQGARWLEEQSLDWEGSNFFFLNEKLKERTLLRVASSQAGENWISTLLLYLFEALLTDPVYGGNPDRIGWRWLGHTPGFPRPGPDKRFDRLT
ncbi:MAG: gluconate 2-dehydrogenase subunit 3 family protein, partial [Gammaproteobacteria bacterium]